MIRLHIKLNKKGALVWSAVLLSLLLGFMAFFPSMSNDAMKELTSGKLESLPPAILSVIGFDSFPDFTNIKVFYGYIMQYVNMALAVYALLIGINWYLKEEKEGTIEYLFSQPQTRLELMRDTFIGNLILVVIIVSCIVLTSILSFVLFKPDDIMLSTLIVDSIPIFGSYYFLGILFLVLGSGLSMILDSSISSPGVAMGIVFIPYVVAIMASLIDALKPLKNISILHTLMPHEIYANNVSLLSIGLWVLLAMSVFVIGARTFKHRDIQI